MIKSFLDLQNYGNQEKRQYLGSGISSKNEKRLEEDRSPSLSDYHPSVYFTSTMPLAVFAAICRSYIASQLTGGR